MVVQILVWERCQGRNRKADDFSKKYRFLFLKSRKTAGSTLEALLFPHLGLADICTGSARDGTPALNRPSGSNGHEKVPKEVIPDDFFTFSIERNPFDKVVSSYFWHINTKPQYFKGDDFETYIEKVNNTDYLPSDWDLYSDCDTVFLYENMAEMYDVLSQYTGLNLTKKDADSMKLKSGFRSEKDYRKLHTNRTVEIINKSFEREISKFHYTY